MKGVVVAVNPAESIDHRFSFHPATDVTGPQHESVRDMLKFVAKELDALLEGSSREKSLVMTKLEEAMMWANAHIARRHTPPTKEGS